ncbi:restriction endonuclease subunit S [Sphingobacterium cellulitidis]|uniref:restriction endonuclease subunit S n=1 Tax=Sphingobacterium cellulitidis TaxID=1768011 RepID=UPI003C79901E
MINKSYLAIEELVETIVDNRGKSVPTIDDIGIPLIATNCIKFSSIYPVFENIRYISKEIYDNWFRAHIEPNDILFVNKGTPGRCCITPNPVNFVGAQDMVGLRFRKEYHPFYMLAVLRSKEIQETIQNNHVGLVIAHFRKQELVKLKLPILDKYLRDYIGEFYKSISYKIELNNKINAELEAMAKTLYDYWFVQFEFPNSEGKPYKSSGGAMEYNSILKREIPKGWEVETIGDLGRVIGGTTPSKAIPENFTNDGIPWITPKDLSINKGNKYIGKGEIDVSSKGFREASLNILPVGSVLMSSRAPVGYLAINRFECTTNQGFKSIVCDNKKYSSEYVFYVLKQYMSTIEANASGSTFKEISANIFRSIKIVKPKESIVKDFIQKVVPIFKKQNNLEEQNQELAQLRDWLLPLLMNGQVKVEDTEEQVLGKVAVPSLDYEKVSAIKKVDSNEDRFELWLSNQKLAARGDIDKVVLREIFDVMDDEDQ